MRMKYPVVLLITLLLFRLSGLAIACCEGDPPGNPDCYTCEDGVWVLATWAMCGTDSDCTGECHGGCYLCTCSDDPSKCTGECHNGCSGGTCIDDDDNCSGCESCNSGVCEDDDDNCSGCESCNSGVCEDDDDKCDCMCKNGVCVDDCRDPKKCCYEREVECTWPDPPPGCPVDPSEPPGSYTLKSCELECKDGELCTINPDEDMPIETPGGRGPLGTYCKEPDPTDGSCTIYTDNKICDWDLLGIISPITAGCIDCEPDCTRYYKTQCYAVRPWRCTTVVGICSCAVPGPIRYIGKHYDCEL